VRVLLVSALIAVAIALAVSPILPGFLHPPLCSTVEAGGSVVESFCISWDPSLGRYETPPPGVPADYGSRFQSTIDPAALAVLIFLGVMTVLWAVITLVSRRLKGRPGVPERAIDP